MSASVIPDFFSTFSVTSTGPVSISAGSEPIIGECPDLCARFEPGAVAGARVADQYRGSAVDDTGRIAGVVDMIDVCDVGMRLDGDGIEAAFVAHLCKRRLQRCQRLHGRAGPQVLVLVEDGEAVHVLHRHDRTGEAAVAPCRRCALLALDRIGIDVVARNPYLVAIRSAEIPCGRK